MRDCCGTIWCYVVRYSMMSPIKPIDLFTMSPHPGVCGQKFKIFPMHTQTKPHKRFFSYCVIPYWDFLPTQVVEAPCQSQFKRLLIHILHDALLSAVSSSLSQAFLQLSTVSCILLISVWYIPPVIHSTPYSCSFAYLTGISDICMHTGPLVATLACLVLPGEWVSE